MAELLFNPSSQIVLCQYVYENGSGYYCWFSSYSDRTTAEENKDSSLTFNDMMSDALVITQNFVDLFNNVDQDTLQDDMENLIDGTDCHIIYSTRM